MILTACESMTGKTTGQTIDDATVTASVQEKLTADKLSNFARINVDTDRGIVTLNGVVRSPEEQSRAEELARQVDGVTQQFVAHQIRHSQEPSAERTRLLILSSNVVPTT